MYPPSKRRREGDDPPSAYLAYAGARVYTPSLRRDVVGYDAFAPSDDRIGLTNRSVRGPALAPTSRAERPESMAMAAQRPRTVYPAMGRCYEAMEDNNERIENSRDYTDRWDPRGPGSRSSTSSPQLPGLSELFATKKRRSPSPDVRPSRSDNNDDHDVVLNRNEDNYYPRRGTSRSSTKTTFPEPTAPRLGASVDRLHRIASPEPVTSSRSSPRSGLVGRRDSMDPALVASEDARPIHGLARRTLPAVLVRNDSTSSVEASTPPADSRSQPSYPCARTLAKSSRYLREIDRRNILQRIGNGEKQAALAKEYQVSRAAICNLNKHRDAVLSRKDENPLAKHPKRPRPKGAPPKIKITSKPAELASNTAFVCELKSRSTALLLTLLRSPETNAMDFRRYADRILRLILEEALALVPVKTIHVAVNDSVQVEGVQAVLPTCAVALEVTGGAHFLRVFHMLEPHMATGSIRIRGAQVDASVPRDLAGHNVFLFDLFTYSGEIVCTALALLAARGVREKCVWLVSLCVAYEVAELVHARFPQVKIITAQVDRSNMPLPADAAPPMASETPTTAPQVVTKPDIPTKVLLKRFLQAYEPRRAPRPDATNSEPQEQQLI